MYVIDSADLYRVNTPVIGTDIFWQIKFYLLTAMHHYWFLHMLQKTSEVANCACYNNSTY